MKPILFPNLGLTIDINNVAMNIGGRDIYWYGIIITAGLLFAIFLASKDKQKYGIAWDDITSFLIYAIMIGFLCARLYFVAFQWDYYALHPDEILKIWHGGIAIYGGVIGAMITGLIFCKKKKISFVSLCDFCVPYLALAQSIGRWGNFVNREAYGEITNSFLKMGIFDNALGEYIYVQPTFLYESMATFCIFVALLLLKRKQKWQGQLFYLYMILYGLARAIIEGLRTDSLYLGNVRISQVLAMVFVISFTVKYVVKSRQIRDKKETTS